MLLIKMGIILIQNSAFVLFQTQTGGTKELNYTLLLSLVLAVTALVLTT